MDQKLRMFLEFILTTDWHHLFEETKAVRRVKRLASGTDKRQNLNPGLTPESAPHRFHQCCCPLLLLLQLPALSLLGKGKIQAGKPRSRRRLRNFVGSTDSAGADSATLGKARTAGAAKEKSPLRGVKKMKWKEAELTPHLLVTECLQANSSAEPAQAERRVPGSLPVG